MSEQKLTDEQRKAIETAAGVPLTTEDHEAIRRVVATARVRQTVRTKREQAEADRKNRRTSVGVAAARF